MNKSFLSPEDAIKHFGVHLLKVLPLESVDFLTLMDQSETNLLSFDYKAKIMSDELPTRAKKVSFFIKEVLEPNPDLCLPALLDVMDKCDDITVLKLSIDIRKKTAPYLTSELRFYGYSVLNGFNVLSSYIFGVTTESYDTVKEWCQEYIKEHWVEENFDWNVSSMNELSNMLKDSSYYNPLNLGLLKFLANKFKDIHLIDSVRSYDKEVSHIKIKDLDFITEIIMIGNIDREKSTSIIATLKEKMTIEEVLKFCTPRLTKRTTSISGNQINANTLILDYSEHLHNFCYSIKDNEIYLTKAKQENQVVDFQHIKILLTGSAAVGKTSFRRLLFQSKHSSVYNSTAVMETQQASSVVTFSIVKHKKEDEWLKLDPESQITCFKKLLASELSHQSNANSGIQERASTSDITDEHTLRAANFTKDPSILCDSENYDKNVKSIQDSNDEKIVNSTSGDGVKQISSSKVDKVKQITVIDGGGQPEYINMLPAINSRPTINFIVFDMTKDLDAPVMVRHKSKHSKIFTDYALHYSNLDLIGLLVSLTSDSLQQANNPDKSCIGFIGTHKDKLEKSKQQEIIEDIDARLKKLVTKAIPVLPAEKGVLFAVDNTTAGDSDTENLVIQKLRIRVEREVNKVKLDYQLKINWMILELELQQLRLNDGTKFVKYKRYQEIAVEKASMVPEEVEESLYHFNSLGVFLHFNKVQGLRDYVIIDHQSLFDSLAMIMHLSPDNIEFQKTEYREQFKRKGLLSKTELHSINWDSDFDLEYLFNLLIYLNVITTVTLDNVEFYYMPCIFPSTKQYSDKYKYLYSEPLLVQFSSGFLPRGFFCSLAVYLLQNLPNGWDHQLHSTKHFSNVMTFELLNKLFLRLHDKTSYLEIQLRHYKGDLEVSHCFKVFQKLSTCFKEVCENLHLNHDNLQYGFPCHEGESSDDHIAIIDPSKLPLPSEIKCCRCSHSTKTGKLHKIWFEEVAPPVDLSNHEETSSRVGEKREKKDLKVSNADDTPSRAGKKRKREDLPADEFYCDDVAYKLKKQVCELARLNYDAMMGSLIAEDVITNNERIIINGKVGAEKMYHLILEIIIPSLKLKNCKKYKGFLKVMEENEDGDLKNMAKRLGGSESVPDILTEL